MKKQHCPGLRARGRKTRGKVGCSPVNIEPGRLCEEV